MKHWIVVIFLGLGLMANAQYVEHNGIKYEVKGALIFKDGKDVTATIPKEQQEEIKTILKETKIASLEAEAAAAAAVLAEKEAKVAAAKLEKERKDAQKAIKRAEKAQKNAEKAQKRAEKALKNKQKAQDNFEKASQRLTKNQAKYDKLKRRGKLSPNDEEKWLKKLESDRIAKEKAKLKLSKT